MVNAGPGFNNCAIIEETDQDEQPQKVPKFDKEISPGEQPSLEEAPGAHNRDSAIPSKQRMGLPTQEDTIPALEADESGYLARFDAYLAGEYNSDGKTRLLI